MTAGQQKLNFASFGYHQTSYSRLHRRTEQVNGTLFGKSRYTRCKVRDWERSNISFFSTKMIRKSIWFDQSLSAFFWMRATLNINRIGFLWQQGNRCSNIYRQLSNPFQNFYLSPAFWIQLKRKKLHRHWLTVLCSQMWESCPRWQSCLLASPSLNIYRGREESRWHWLMPLPIRCRLWDLKMTSSSFSMSVCATISNYQCSRITY